MSALYAMPSAAAASGNRLSGVNPGNVLHSITYIELVTDIKTSTRE